MLKSYPFGCRTLKSFKHVESHNKICVSVIWGGVGVGWGGAKNVHVNLNTNGSVISALGLGRGGVGR